MNIMDKEGCDFCRVVKPLTPRKLKNGIKKLCPKCIVDFDCTRLLKEMADHQDSIGDSYSETAPAAATEYYKISRAIRYVLGKIAIYEQFETNVRDTIIASLFANTTYEDVMEKLINAQDSKNNDIGRLKEAGISERLQD